MHENIYVYYEFTNEWKRKKRNVDKWQATAPATATAMHKDTNQKLKWKE